VRKAEPSDAFQRKHSLTKFIQKLAVILFAALVVRFFLMGMLDGDPFTVRGRFQIQPRCPP
jgi:hypothetical protein